MTSEIVSYWSILYTTLEEKHDFVSLLHYAEVDSEAEITENYAFSVDSIKIVSTLLLTNVQFVFPWMGLSADLVTEI